jgi:molecular chaperone GrpE
MNAERPNEAIDDTQEETPEVEAGADVAEEAVEPADELAAAQAKADENWERYVRAAAELENVRKRASRDVANAHKYALERFGKELLAVKDTRKPARGKQRNAEAPGDHVGAFRDCRGGSRR